MYNIISVKMHQYSAIGIAPLRKMPVDISKTWPLPQLMGWYTNCFILVQAI
jgi:hypothetical protein